MRKKALNSIVEEKEIPAGVEVEINGQEIAVKKEGKEIRKKMPKVMMEKKENKIIVKTMGATKRERKQINTIISHISNMLAGLETDYVYKLQICSVHFPMNVAVKDNLVIIKNFLGETKERKAKILDNVTVKIDREIITVSSPDKEAAGQTAGNIEKRTRTRNKDRRIFQDGIYMTEQAGIKL
ncbi:hypothetical protein A3K73_09190 [Candidatus Pacearchaeota archaeon RBG_13_36_9]|nr:large subunit ribosomal protein L6 [uncultured archaeon]OGJ21396.1 MAG: hypothetical protein A3K73_09190 [Candidatus Pacearchaeota archaeon RBG_13_36_9]